MLGVITAQAFAQEAKPRVVAPEGPEFFGHVLHSAGFKAVKSIDDVEGINPSSLLIVLFGSLDTIPAIEARLGSDLETFVAAGGAVLIASDRAAPRRLFRTGFPGFDDAIFERLPRRYQDLKRCPLITVENCTDAQHPIFARLFLSGQALAANHPALLRVPADGASQSLLQFPGLQGSLAAGPRADDPRRFLLIGGHGIFMNQMMAQPDLENYDFAANIVDWLGDGDRRRVLFVNEASVVERIGLTPPINFTQIINRGIAGLQRAFAGLQRRHADRFSQILVLAATGLVFLYGLKRFIGNRYHVEQPMHAVGAPQHPAPDSLAQARIDQLLARNQFWEATQVLIRRFFRTEAGIDFPLTGLQPPRAEYRAGKWERWGLASALGRVWTLAQRSPVQNATARQIGKLRTDLDTLSRALRDGKLVFSASVRDKTIV